MTNHTKGELKVVNEGRTDGKTPYTYLQIGSSRTIAMFPLGSSAMPNANRLALCWNACDGLTDEQLTTIVEIGGFAKLTVEKAESAGEAVLLVALALRDDTIAQMRSALGQAFQVKQLCKKFYTLSDTLRVKKTINPLGSFPGLEEEMKAINKGINEHQTTITEAIKL